MKMSSESSHKNYIVGTCIHMCPVAEIKMRENHNLLHPFEMVQGTQHNKRPVADWKLMVKEYTRPAAGKFEAASCDLRPAPVLLNTVHFLMNHVLKRTDCPWSNIYDYVFDRLRAVRQDMVIQNISGQEAISLLQIIVRFYVYSGYRLCREKVSVFDPHINSSHAQECLKRLLTLYAETPVNCHHRSEFESLYLIYNMGNMEALYHGMEVKTQLWSSPLFRTSLYISLAHFSSNFIRLIKYVSKLPPIHLCGLHRHLVLMNRKTLEIMSSGFHSKTLTFPLNKLCKLLMVDNEAEARDICNIYGLTVTDGKVVFNKAHFRSEEKDKPRCSKLVEGRIKDCSFGQLMCTSCDS